MPSLAPPCDKGASIKARVGELEEEIRTLEAEVAAKHGRDAQPALVVIGRRHYIT